MDYLHGLPIWTTLKWTTPLRLSDQGYETERIRFHLGSLYWKTDLKLDSFSLLTLITRLQRHCSFQGKPHGKSMGVAYGLGGQCFAHHLQCQLLHIQGSKKVLSGHRGLVEFPAGQATFHSHLPGGQGSRQVICPLN